jgi:hypothetical protein
MKITHGQLDYTFPFLVPMLMKETFGEAADEKDNEDRKKTFMELRKSKVFETF